MTQKESAGLAIIYRGMVLLAHTTGRKWWGSYGIPKGGIEPGESRMDAAIRETREEVGLDIPRSMIDPNPRTYVLTSRKYKYTKTVYWYAVQVEDLGQIGMKSLVVPKSQLQLEEVDWAGFMPLAEAKKRAMSSQQQLLTQLVGLGLLESRHSGEIYKTEHQKKPNTMKHVKLFEQFINEAAVKYPDSFKDEKAMEDFARIHGFIRYGYGNGGSAMGINDFDHKDENYREPWYGFKEMLRHYARNFDFVHNEPKRYVKEYEKLVDDWMDSELKSIPKFMKKYLTVGTMFSSSLPAYLIKPELQDDLVYVPLQNASKDLKQQYVAHRMKFAGEDVSKKLGL